LEPATDREISLFDVADWLWSYRVLAVLLALAGLTGAAAVWFFTPPATATFRTTVSVYSSGTPVRTATEITDILLGQLADSIPNVVVGTAASPLMVDFVSTADVETARQTIDALEASLLAEVMKLQADTAPLVGTSEAALTLNLDAKAFIEGSNTGLIKIVRVAVQELTAQRQLRTPIMVMVAAGFMFLALAGTHSFWTRWRTISRAP
jgi:hypothetical protein